MDYFKILKVVTYSCLIAGVIISTTYIIKDTTKEKITATIDNSTTVVIVQEEQEMSVTEIVEDTEDAEFYIPAHYKPLVLSLCEKEDVPVYVFAKLIHSESRWNPKAKNINYVYNADGTPVLNKDGTRKIHSIDRGIAQLNSLNNEEFSIKFNNNQKVDPYNVQMSLTISCRYLSWLYDRTHSWYDAVCAYKSGIGNVKAEKVPIHIKVISEAIIDPTVSSSDKKFFP